MCYWKGGARGGEPSTIVAKLAGRSKRPPARPQQATRRSVLCTYVEPLSDARTQLAVFFNGLLPAQEGHDTKTYQQIVHGMREDTG